MPFQVTFTKPKNRYLKRHIQHPQPDPSSRLFRIHGTPDNRVRIVVVVILLFIFLILVQVREE